jgi:hypothetical protein
MKGKIFMTLFALPFFSVGVWMLWSIGGAFVDTYQMRDWVPVEAQLLAGGYETHTGDDSYTYEAYAQYSYNFAGQRYIGNRVSIAGGADNVGDYQQATGRRLSNSLARGETITVFVDTENPADAIIDRDIRWALVGFKSIFLFTFGGVGLGLLILVWRAPKEKDKSDPKYASSPWLLNDDWQSATIRSNSKASMYAIWAFAVFWNLISAPLPFIMYDEVVNKKNTIALVGLLFTAVGLWLITWAIRRTLEWRRFGPTPVVLDPFPGSIGGHVGGTIEIALPFDASHDFEISLTNIHSYVSGSGKNRSRKENAKWQDAIVAHAEPGGTGTRLTFRFDVPDGLNESDGDQDDNYHIWRLAVSAELDGTDLDRSYDIPVYATAQHSRSLSGLAMERAREKQQFVSDRDILKVVQLRNDAGGRRLVYPIGRYIGSALGGFIVGAAFAAVGWWLVTAEGQTVFGSVFGGVGALVGVFALYMMVNSLEVARDANGIKTTRRILGIPVKRSYLNRNSFVKFKKKSSHKTQQGNKHIVHYTIYAVDIDGDKVVVGEGFKGESQANAAIRLISRELGLAPKDAPRRAGDESTESWDPAGLLSRTQ